MYGTDEMRYVDAVGLQQWTICMVNCLNCIYEYCCLASGLVVKLACVSSIY